MLPAPGARLLKFVGDRIRFELRNGDGHSHPAHCQARMRTNLGRASVINQEILEAQTRKRPFGGASWHDLPMHRDGEVWWIELPLTEIGYFSAKCYFLDESGQQFWPDGPDAGVSVHPDGYRTANTIYCAFTRMFGESRHLRVIAGDPGLETALVLDQQGYAVIPPSGKFRDLARQLPHIIDNLGCRILHLLPVNPTPTTFARFGRFGSPYASLNLTAIDPALVEFDQRTTGVEQFMELAHAVHANGARLFLDIVINHTGWGSTLQENHPEWFKRKPDGSFASPGAWGTVWEDLVELEHGHVALWETVAESLLTWCRRGVDGFRCDAGYQVPLPAWQFIIARVRQEFPQALFLLEGLGGAWELTENLITTGGMQWAYSELFQNYSPLQISGYLDHSLAQSARTGVLVNYSETHDNERLARLGRNWSLLRNRLCALTATNGAYGFTCGVEWLAPERVNVHSCRGLAWGNPDNLVPELGRLNRLLADHPCFFDGAIIQRLSAPESPVYALKRTSAEGLDLVVVLVNTDLENPQALTLPDAMVRELGRLEFELLGQIAPVVKSPTPGELQFQLQPAEVLCLSGHPTPRGLAGELYRMARARAAWAFQALGQLLSVEFIGEVSWRTLARWVDQNPEGFLGAVSELAAQAARGRHGTKHVLAHPHAPQGYLPVVTWTMEDARRITLVPPGHWLLLRDGRAFRAVLKAEQGTASQHVESIPAAGGHLACFKPATTPGDAALTLERFDISNEHVRGTLRFLNHSPSFDSNLPGQLSLDNLHSLREIATAAKEVKRIRLPGEENWQPLVLLTNGIGGMARLGVDFGSVKSKYDCLLGANLNARVPVDRHIFAKRARAWVNADGFITPLDLRNLASFQPGPPATWYFVANAGDGRTVEIQIIASMLEDLNTVILHFDRPTESIAKSRPLPPQCEVRLTIRVDIEDRGFHWETRRNPGADYHFASNTRQLSDGQGFSFTPGGDRQLRAYITRGIYHPQPEWCENLPHSNEQSRGQTGAGDAYSPGWFELPLALGAGGSIVVSAEAVLPSPEEIHQSRFPSDSTIVERSPEANLFPHADIFGWQLLRAARSYVVRRGAGVTIIAGYPWFLDWGRDSLICARGLLAAGMIHVVKQLLVVFGRFVQEGTLPNTIHGDDASNRDTSDAPLWYGLVCEELAAVEGAGFYATPVGDNGSTIEEVLLNIAEHYRDGTPNGIRMDPESGLVWSPSHFTWMDTNYPAGTPREGYPVEIQALWVRLLLQLSRIRPAVEKGRWSQLAAVAQASLHRYFWLEELGYVADLLIAGTGKPASEGVVDDALRSNGLIAISLGLFKGVQARRSVLAAARHLVVPGGLRSLAPLPVSLPRPIHGASGGLLNDPVNPYWGRYEGDEDTRRKPAYHNGTAWGWTFPIFCEALCLAWEGDVHARAAARAYLGSLDQVMMSGCIGQLPEIMDGDAPHTPRGCDAQAWSVTEALRVWKWLNTPA